MLKIFSTSQGIDIFSKSSSNYLIHEWSRAPNLSSFSYRMASRDVHGEPSITVSTKFIHVSFVNSKKELCHLQINRNSPNESKHRVLAQSVNQHISLSSCCSGNEIYIYFIKTDGKLIESKLKVGHELIAIGSPSSSSPTHAHLLRPTCLFFAVLNVHVQHLSSDSLRSFSVSCLEMVEKASSGELDVAVLKGEADAIYKEIVKHAGEWG